MESMSNTTLKQVRKLVADAETLEADTTCLSTANNNLTSKVSRLPTFDYLNKSLPAENDSLRTELHGRQSADAVTTLEKQVDKLSLQNDELQSTLVTSTSETVRSQKEPANLELMLTFDKPFEVLEERDRRSKKRIPRNWGMNCENRNQD
jgi:hypothetical protein